MYVTNDYICYAINGANACTPQHHTPEINEEENGTFQGILADTINDTPAPTAPVATATAATATAATAETATAAPTPHMDSIPPVITLQETAGSSYVSQYYPIPESEAIPKLAEVRHIINSEDFSAKTNTEIYEFIENRFIEAFGNDFLIARNLNMASSMFYMVGVEFDNNLRNHIPNPEQTNRERLYGDASTDAIQDKIRSSYPAELSHRDIFMMVHEMRNAGVLDAPSAGTTGADGRRIMDTLGILKHHVRYKAQPSGHNNPLSLAERERLWVDMLNKRVGDSNLRDTFNVWKERGRVNIGQDAAQFLVKFMNGVLGPDGLFVGGPRINDDDDGWWETFLDNVFDDFSEYDDLISSRMDAINALYSNMKVDELAVAGVTEGVEEIAAVGETAGAEEAMQADENTEAGEDSGSGETAGAEENVSTGSGDDS